MNKALTLMLIMPELQKTGIDPTAMMMGAVMGGGALSSFLLFGVGGLIGNALFRKPRVRTRYVYRRRYYRRRR